MSKFEGHRELFPKMLKRCFFVFCFFRSFHVIVLFIIIVFIFVVDFHRSPSCACRIFFLHHTMTSKGNAIRKNKTVFRFKSLLPFG